MSNFGPHLTLDLVGCEKSALTDYFLHWRVLHELPPLIGMTKITQPYVFPYHGAVPEDRGITGMVIIAESHISIHSFEEKGYTFIDVFSCKEFDVDAAADYLLDIFKPTSSDIQLARRGREFPR